MEWIKIFLINNMKSYIVTYTVRTTIEAESESEVINIFDQTNIDDLNPTLLEVNTIEEL